MARWTTRYEWSYRHQNSPIPRQQAIDTFAFAARAIPNSRNSCGMDDRVDATQTYLGETSAGPNISRSGDDVFCDPGDGQNVVGWGPLPPDILGVACVYSRQSTPTSWEIVEADIRIRPSEEWFAGTTVPSGCTNGLSLRSVATHEFGHVFGLGHAVPACSEQVMKPTASLCEVELSDFGRGDIRGLRALY